MTTPNTGKIEKKIHHSFIGFKNQNNIDSVGNNMAISYKTKHVT